MNCTDEVWVAGVEETAMAPPRLTPTHSGILGMAEVWRFWFGFSLRELGVGSDRTRLDTPVLHPHQGYLCLSVFEDATSNYFAVQGIVGSCKPPTINVIVSAYRRHAFASLHQPSFLIEMSGDCSYQQRNQGWRDLDARRLNLPERQTRKLRLVE
jgi:hypothetical protein